MKIEDMMKRSDDCEEFCLHDWVDGDDRLVIVHYKISQPNHYDDLPDVTVIGALTTCEDAPEIFDRAEFAALIGEKYVGMIEDGKAEKLA